jgi:hypothetical protein
MDKEHGEEVAEGAKPGKSGRKEANPKTEGEDAEAAEGAAEEREVEPGAPNSKKREREAAQNVVEAKSAGVGTGKELFWAERLDVGEESARKKSKKGKDTVEGKRASKREDKKRDKKRDKDKDKRTDKKQKEGKDKGEDKRASKKRKEGKDKVEVEEEDTRASKKRKEGKDKGKRTDKKSKEGKEKEEDKRASKKHKESKDEEEDTRASEKSKTNSAPTDKQRAHRELNAKCGRSPWAMSKGLATYTFEQFTAWISCGDLGVLYGLQKLGVIPNNHACPDCGDDCKLYQKKEKDRQNTKYNWRCHRCNHSQSLLTHSFFDRFDSPARFLIYAYLELVLEAQQTRIMSEMGLSQDAATSFRQNIQEILGDQTRLINVQLNDVTEIDATYRGGMKTLKLTARDESEPRGALRFKNSCLNVVVQRGSRRLGIDMSGAAENQVSMNRTASAWCEPGTTLISDAGSSMNKIAEAVGGGSVHMTNKHCEGFKDKYTEVHSNTVEGRNMLLDRYMLRKGNTFGLNEEVMWSNIKQYLWQQWFTDGSGTMRLSMFLMGIFDQHGYY